MHWDATLHARFSKYLTSELLDQLPDAAVLPRAAQQLASLHKTLCSYLPLYIAEDETRLSRDWVALSPGVFLFADVSGFTALSEQLRQRAGAMGIEILTEVINDYFATMLEILAKSDGHLLKFAGDALLAFFPAQRGKDDAPKAIKTGLRMQRAMQERYQPIQHAALRELFGQGHAPELAMSIGIARGQLFEALVGGLAQRDHMIMGTLPGQAMAAEEVGERDDVIVPLELAAAHASQFTSTPVDEAFARIEDTFGEALGDYEFSLPLRKRIRSGHLFTFDEADLLRETTRALERVENVARFVSSAITNRLVVKGDHIESENRLTTTVFVHFTGIAELLEVWGADNLGKLAAVLSRYYSLMQAIIVAHGGVLTRSDPYKLGTKLLITFGAPMAHPDDPLRAVNTALAMNQQLERLNARLQREIPALAAHPPFLKQRMGISFGEAFAGEVGWKQRREYTVMGDEVNLAARLMARAEFGEVWLSEPVWQQVETHIEGEALPPFAAKGKSQPIQAYRALHPHDHTEARTSDTPFVGRQVAFFSLVERLNAAREGLQPWLLYGEPGVGKTRLARELAGAARHAGFRVAWTTCQRQNTRKTTLARLVRQLLNLEVDSEEALQAALDARLAALGLEDQRDGLRFLLLSEKTADRSTPQRARSKVAQDIFNRLDSEQGGAIMKDEVRQFQNQLGALGAPETSVWSQLQVGVSLTETLVGTLRHLAQAQPLLLVIDDLHKDNPHALRLLRRLLAYLGDLPIFVLATYEALGEAPPKLGFEMPLMRVADLNEDETYLMASAMLNGAELGPRLAHTLWQRTTGRPLYVEALLGSLRAAEHLEDAEGIAELKAEVRGETVPDSVRGLVISLLDHLPAEVREVAQVAAVLGDPFSMQDLRLVGEFSPMVLPQRMAMLEAHHFIEAEMERVGMYRFTNGITHQAIYEELSRLHRQKLHLRVATYLAKQTDLASAIVARSDHLIKAGAPTQALAVLTEAAEAAQAANDYETAADLFGRALEILPTDSTLQTNLTIAQRLAGS
ncbi:MAG: AAA family ATPase [Anaerolineae bacterium]|nr:AAA family ATPase [Anaerolineae bacterium]